MKIETIRIDWSDVKARLLSSVRDGKHWGQAKQEQLVAMHRSPKSVDSFYSTSGEMLIDWLTNGFYSEDLRLTAANRVPVAAMAQIGWSEEPSGDIELSRLYGGYDDYYFEVAEQDVKPGLKIEFDLFFAALVPSKTVTAYGAWLASLVSALETAGYDLTVDAVGPVRNLCEGTRGKRSDVQITVKRPGELSDFASWSALMSPAGTRVCLFTAFGVAADQIGKDQTSHMATSLEPHERGWGVEYDAAANVLRVTAAQRESGDFPTNRMNDALNASGLMG